MSRKYVGCKQEFSTYYFRLSTLDFRLKYRKSKIVSREYVGCKQEFSTYYFRLSTLDFRFSIKISKVENRESRVRRLQTRVFHLLLSTFYSRFSISNSQFSISKKLSKILKIPTYSQTFPLWGLRGKIIKK